MNQMNSQFYALMRDDRVKLISLNQETVAAVKELFLRGAEALMNDSMEVDEFNGDILARNGENITYVNYELPADFDRIPNNQADMSRFEIGEDVPKSIFWYEDGRYIFQVFNKRSLLTRKTILKLSTEGNFFGQLQEDAFIVEDKVSAIYKDGKLYFQNYVVANQIFSLVDYITEATNSEIESFADSESIAVNPERVKAIANVKTRRLIKLLSATDNIAVFSQKTSQTKKRLLNKYGVNANFDANGKLILPTHKVAELNRVLEFLNEDIFRGVITGSLYRSNSKKRD